MNRHVDFLVRGLLAGLIAGLLAFAVAYTVGEPQVDAAIAVEEAAAAHEAEHAENPPADGHTHEHETTGTEVSRANQSTWGLATGTLAVGITLGGVVGLASAFAVGRIGRLRPSQSTALVALIGFVAVGLVPFLKYPATPPAVGNADTIASRTLEFFAMHGHLACSPRSAPCCWRVACSTSLGTYRAVVVSAGAYLVVVIVAALLLPTVNEIGDFPADTLWYFRRGVAADHRHDVGRASASCSPG